MLEWLRGAHTACTARCRAAATGGGVKRGGPDVAGGVLGGGQFLTVPSGGTKLLTFSTFVMIIIIYPARCNLSDMLITNCLFAEDLQFRQSGRSGGTPSRQS